MFGEHEMWLEGDTCAFNRTHWAQPDLYWRETKSIWNPLSVIGEFMGFLEVFWVDFQFREMGGHLCLCLSGHNSYRIPHYFSLLHFAEPSEWDFGFDFPWLCNPSRWVGETSVLALLQVTLRGVRSASDNDSDSSEWILLYYSWNPVLFCCSLGHNTCVTPGAHLLVPSPGSSHWEEHK